MATKKPISDEPFGKSVEAGSVEALHSPTAIPVVPAVDTQHVAETQSRRETVVNQHYRELMAYLIVLRDSFHDGQVQADFNQAIMATRTAHLWALQAVKNVS
jgi:hypothetical protein